MKWVKRLFLFCALLVVWLSVAPAQAKELTAKSLTIKEKLIDLKTNSAIVTEQLKTLSEDLTLSCVKNIKFLRILSPNEVTEICYSLAKISREDDQIKVQVTVTAGEDTYAKLSLICQIAA